MKKKIELIMAVILLVSAGFLAKRGAIYVQQSKVAKTQTCIVIDAGHGGDEHAPHLRQPDRVVLQAPEIPRQCHFVHSSAQ